LINAGDSAIKIWDFVIGKFGVEIEVMDVACQPGPESDGEFGLEVSNLQVRRHWHVFYHGIVITCRNSNEKPVYQAFGESFPIGGYQVSDNGTVEAGNNKAEPCAANQECKVGKQEGTLFTIYPRDLGISVSCHELVTMMAHRAPNCRMNRRLRPTLPSMGAAASPRLSRNNRLWASKMTGRMGLMTTRDWESLYGTNIS
jgi:hypothetical protein